MPTTEPLDRRGDMPADWIVPDWPAPAHVRALCTTRVGGVSDKGYASLNLGDHVGDLAAHVAVNRERLRDAAAARPVFLRQVHGTDCVPITPDSADGMVADACFTNAPHVACTVMVADCLPVLMCAADGSSVAAAHAGWRGLAGGVLEQAYASFSGLEPVDIAQAAMKNVANSAPRTSKTPERAGASCIAWLGPCIGPTAFEVGDDVKAAFEAQAADAAACFRPGERAGKWLADLPALARQRLRAMGVSAIYGNDGSAPWCTVRNASRFFSYRRDGAGSGRFAALVWRV